MEQIVILYYQGLDDAHDEELFDIFYTILLYSLIVCAIGIYEHTIHRMGLGL
jgi:hypothetical protein